MRRPLTLLILLILGGLTVAGIEAWQWYRRSLSEVLPLTQPATVFIPRGAPLAQIAKILEESGIVGSARVFQLHAMISGSAKRLQAGEYQIEPGATLASLTDQLARGAALRRQLTLPEGLTTLQIFSRIEPLVERQLLTGPMPPPDSVPEGVLAPSTLAFERGESVQSLLRRFAKLREEEIEALWPKRQPDLPFETWAQALVLASIVERETGVPSERRRVAGVFVNRLRRGMPLQSDPTVIYALSRKQGTLPRPLTRADLQLDTEWNTYTRRGLPPTPIAHPGREALEAVLNPEPHEYLYFVAAGADPRDGHVFARSYDEHLRNVAAYRAARDRAR